MKKFAISLVLTICFYSIGFSSVKDGGIIGLNPSVRAASLANSYTANNIDDPFSFFLNPAFSPESIITGLMYSAAFSDNKNDSQEAFGAFSFLYPDFFYGFSLGLGAAGSMEGNINTEQDFAAYLNLSKKISFFSIGANLKYIYSKYYRNSDSAQITGDFGLLADFGFLSIGAAGYNLAGDFYDLYGERVKPSLSAGISLNYDYEGVGIVFFIDGLQPDIDEMRILPGTALEIFYSFFGLRAGYRYDDRNPDKDDYSFGFGIDAYNILFDYAFVPDGNNKDLHKISLSYKFNRMQYKVDNEIFKNQVKLEKQQRKENLKLEKQEAKELAKKEKEQRRLEKEEARLKEKERKIAASGLPFRPAPVTEDEEEAEFFAVLAPVDMESTVASRVITEVKKPVYSSPQPEKGEFDAAQYLLELERNKNRRSSPVIEIEPNYGSVKQHSYDATPHNDDDYDPAKELLQKMGYQEEDVKISGSKKKKEKFNIVSDASDETVKEKKPKKVKAPKQKKSKETGVEEENDFDAARYILANPGETKIKQYYVQPTEHSDDDYDPAMFLLGK